MFLSEFKRVSKETVALPKAFFGLVWGWGFWVEWECKSVWDKG